MKTKVLEKNREYANKYFQNVKNPVLSKEIRNFLSKKEVKKVIDLGCGEGSFIYALKLFDNSINVTGIDISERRINGLKKKFPNDNFYVRDVCDTKLKEKFDFVHSSQVIEHVENDKKMVKEISRLLKKEGILFCSSVIKKPGAIYKYRNNKKFVLDPTHEREYVNKEEFLNLFKEDFKLIKSWVEPVRRNFLGLNFRIPGYYLVFGIWKKRK